jgi:TRAP-type C4-dicarboxylate transport system permease small subunit
MEQATIEGSIVRRIVKRISEWMVVVSCVMLAIMMFVSTADVIGRYFFDKPLEGSWELTGMSLVVCGSFAMAYTQFVKGHIQINIICDRLSRRWRAGVYIFSYTVCIIACALVVWQAGTRMVDYFGKTVGGETISLGMPIWPFMLAMVIGFFWIALTFIVDIYDCFVEVLKP